jgi:hypothetical protein
MGKSYRIKATPGKDQNLVLQVDQDFEQLEILSLKIRQSDVYTRMCSDYGVIAGRVFANNGYGIPKAKLSIFIPVSDQDLQNPTISTIYPYKTLSDTNEDGYIYNLLPYLPSYPGHVATGTFPSRKDNLVDQTAIEIYDKYYKYTVQTNESGDFLIYGVPVGTHTLVMNVDLSDIGQFSMTPHDLIRMGIATTEQVDGVKFKASTNLLELPQIIIINKSIEVSPFWGEEDVCQIGITRTDFDLTAEKNVKIQPTSIFLGSLLSGSNNVALKTNCKAKKNLGDLCQLVTGPGEILAITQTIFNDANGLPILEQAKLPNAGKLIDGDGNWMFDLPMNYNYVTTDEFGNIVISDDPTVGVPTQAKYRFKIKWQQSKSISEDYKRAYYLVPNLKEKGWTNSSADPLIIGGGALSNMIQSYAFDLDWSAYTFGSLNLLNNELLSYINCEDRFYLFDYNKVYTVSGLIDNFKFQNNKERFIGIKQIGDLSCDDNVNPFPVNDGVFHTPLLWIILNIVLSIIGVVLLPIIIMYDFVAFLINLIYKIVVKILCELCGIRIIRVRPFGWICRSIGLDCNMSHSLLHPLKLPVLTYPDCEACDCDTGAQANAQTPVTPDPDPQPTPATILPLNNPNTYTDLVTNFSSVFPFPCFSPTHASKIIELISGTQATDATTYTTPDVVYPLSKKYVCNDLPLGERINLFNAKGSYFTGRNQVRVVVEPAVNNSNPNLFHLDNTLTFLANENGPAVWTAGTLFSFVRPGSSLDPNVTGATTNSFGTNSLTGTTNYPSSVQITYASLTQRAGINSNIPVTYNTPQIASNAGSTIVYSYPSDIEYFQVITAMTITQFRAINSTALNNSFSDILESNTTIYSYDWDSLNLQWIPCSSKSITPIDYVDNEQVVVIVQRGVDPYSPKTAIEFDLSKIFGLTSFGSAQHKVTGQYRLNVPIKNSDQTLLQSGEIYDQVEIMYDHQPSPTQINNGTANNGFNLFFPSVFFQPSPSYSQYPTNNHKYYSSICYRNTYGVYPPAAPSPFPPAGYNVSPPNPTYLLNYTQVNARCNNVSVINACHSVAVPYKDIVSQDGSPNGNHYWSSTFNVPQKYDSNESIVGASYMFKSTSGVPVVYYSPIYTYYTTPPMIMSNGLLNVMRSDRLPSSDTYPASSSQNNNTYLLQQNQSIVIYPYSNTGAVQVLPGVSTGGSNQDGSSESGATSFEDSALATFNDCSALVDLNCYRNSGLGLTVDQSCKDDDIIDSSGCYVFCKNCDNSNPFKILTEDIAKDIASYPRWFVRFKFFYGLCQGVLSEVFNNNWVNGTLFAFPFKINTYYNSLNQVSQRKYCPYVIVLHPTTNNFYYRSSPWDGTSFIGANSPGRTDKGSNSKNLKYPTTVFNMGPRDEFLKYITLNGNYEGYNMKNFTETTHHDNSDIVNLFGILRIIDSSFLNSFVGNQIRKLFSRNGLKVDADFAQTAAVNTQLGIVPFDTSAGAYSTTPPANSVLAANVTATNSIMMGVFFSATTEGMQIRDYLSPVRTIRWNVLFPTVYAYDYVPIHTQLTPHYSWNLQSSTTVFGSQLNEWGTNTVGTEIRQFKYQAMDRLSDPYPKYNIGVNQYNAKGYIYADNSNNPTTSLFQDSGITFNPPQTLGGAPFYFYFGLKKGVTSLNKFRNEFLGEINYNDQ